ncbi:oxidoreductase ptaK [Lachnellula suecica]|uniref:laccase n=1 Tax=Lachnellula suecica TaxID=602035 RepID=A0A8T9C263_9HELO|nr:oxidoreductase ptaK [Lachnellula suecica]
MGLLGNILGGLLGIVATLSQQQTNGNSVWGTLQSPLLPLFLTNNPLPNGFPWGLLTAKANNPYTSAPNTGVIRAYDFTINRGQIAPDGYQKDVILINGAFPGPLIEANWGDTFQITVHNEISNPEEGTSLHWHGLLQKATPWFDGVPGVSECPVAPGSSFTYSFKADLYGSSWYHSHYSAQYAATDGLFGPMIIHGPKNANYDIDLGPVMLSDLYHTEYFKLVEASQLPVADPNFTPAPLSDNNLINGKMNFDCSTVAAGDKTPCQNNAGVSKFKFTTGKTHLLRLINTGGEGIQRFTIDGHNMTVVANDFVPLQPYTTNVVTLAPGQRSDVLVTANAKSNSAFWMRSNISATCSFSKQGNALAAIYYDKADTTKSPTSTAQNAPDPGNCQNDDLSLTVPYYSITPPSPAVTQNLDIANSVNATGHFVWTLGGNTFRANYNQPVLLLANQKNYSYPAEWNVKNYGTNSSVRVIVNNPGPAAHPMHLHGHNMEILHQGTGNWDGVTITNPNNPQRRDVQLVPPGGHFVFQYNTDNPGVWPFHCHIIWHVSGGLYANLLEQPASIANDVPIPMVMGQTCRNWATYTNTDVVDQIDSGV